MLGFLKPRGDLVEIKGRTVVFLSMKAYRVDQRFEVRLNLPNTESDTLSVPIRVMSCRASEEGDFVVVGAAEGRRQPPELVGTSLRNGSRPPHRITVKSEGLPSYRAVTSNLSPSGFGAELDGELPAGKILDVHFEFEEPIGFTLDLKARVVWATWKSQNRFETGFEFLEEAGTQAARKELADWLQARAVEQAPFMPPENLPPRRPKEPPNQLPKAAPPQHPKAPTVVSPKAVTPNLRTFAGYDDDDPTPLGLPTIDPFTVRPKALKLPESGGALARPSSFPLPPVVPKSLPLSAEPSVPAPARSEQPLETPVAQPEVVEEDIGVHVFFEANLRGWAWEGADDAVVVVLEDPHGIDHWLEFPNCRGLQARCRERQISLLGMAVAKSSALITELTRPDSEETLLHFRFYDDHQRTVLDVVASECRQQER